MFQCFFVIVIILRKCLYLLKFLLFVCFFLVTTCVLLNPLFIESLIIEYIANSQVVSTQLACFNEIVCACMYGGGVSFFPSPSVVLSYGACSKHDCPI